MYNSLWYTTPLLLYVFAFRSRLTYWNTQKMSEGYYLQKLCVCVKTFECVKYTHVVIVPGHTAGIYRNTFRQNRKAPLMALTLMKK